MFSSLVSAFFCCISATPKKKKKKKSSVGPYYFAIVRESDLMKLKAENITAILKDYLSLAPVESILTDPKWEKHHIRNIDECTDQSVTKNERTDCQASFYFKEDVLPSTDPTFIVRDPVSTAKARPSQVRLKTNKTKHTLTAGRGWDGFCARIVRECSERALRFAAESQKPNADCCALLSLFCSLFFFLFFLFSSTKPNRTWFKPVSKTFI